MRKAIAFCLIVAVIGMTVSGCGDSKVIGGGRI